MNPHERQQFDLFLALAVERFAERIEQRNGGPGPALERLRTAPESEGVWLSDFVRALFTDFLLADAAGACFVLQALERRPVESLERRPVEALERRPAEALERRPAESPAAGTIGALLGELARGAFARLLAAKTEEYLEQRAGYQAVDLEGAGDRA